MTFDRAFVDNQTQRVSLHRSLVILFGLLALGACQTLSDGPTTTGRPNDELIESAFANLDLAAAKTYIGQGENQLVKVLGQPALVRREKSAQIWQYAAQSCVLLAYFYKTENGLTLRHMDALSTAPSAPEADLDTCLKAQAKANIAKKLSLG